VGGKVVAVCGSSQRGTPKSNWGSGVLEPGWGLRGDGHAGTGQPVSLLVKEWVDRLSLETGWEFPPGAFAENILVEGLKWEECQPGSFLRVGKALLKVLRIGKDPAASHSYNYRGYSLLVQFGIFADVVEGGTVQIGDEVLIFSIPKEGRKSSEGP